MHNKPLQLSLAKAISIFVFVCLLASAVGPGLASAEQPSSALVQPDLARPTASVSPAPRITKTPAPALELTPTVMLTPTAQELTKINPSIAGEGTRFRARIQLRQPNDLERLQGWKIKVLVDNGSSAFVEVDQAELEQLARLGFRPDRIDSLEYLVAVHNTLKKGRVIRLDDLEDSPRLLMSLSSVNLDNDGLTDTEEAWWCTNPQDNNSDFAGDPSEADPNDGDEVQAILKGITSYGPPFEMWPNFKPYHADGTCLDGDFDGAPDNAELYMLGTSPQRESSDLDKFDDGQELFGVTFCPGASGPCGYGILPRAEDAAFVSANLPAWVKAPGNSPFVAAFPEPAVEVVPSSLKVTQVTIITNTKGTTIGTEKTYGTSSTKGTSSSQADTVTWNQWEETAISTPQYFSQNLNPQFVTQTNSSNPSPWVPILSGVGFIAAAADCLSTPATGLLGIAGCALALTATGGGFVVSTGGYVDEAHNFLKSQKSQSGLTGNSTPDQLQSSFLPNSCTPSLPAITLSCSGTGFHSSTNQEYVSNNRANTSSQNRVPVSSETLYGQSSQSWSMQKTYPVTFPVVQVPVITSTSGTSRGGAHTTTTTEYQEQTISESSTNQYSDNWSTAIAQDTSHAADLRFTYNIVNNGTEYAREVTSLTFNIYIGNDPNPAYTYVAVGATGQIAKIENLFPGDSLTYTSDPIALTLDEMRSIDEGAPIRVVMEDISFGQDQVFYLDALNGSVTVAMEDGYDDLDETMDSYLIPVWSPTDTVQDVVKRYFPVIEDTDGNLLAVFTPESKSAIPASCVQDASIAPASNTQVFCKHALTGTSWWNFYLSDGLNYSDAFKDTLAASNSAMLVRIVSDRDLDGYNDRNEIRIGTDPDSPVSHPSPNLIAAYTKSCTGNDCTLRMTFQNLGNYDAYGVEAVLYSPDGLATITNNTIGGSGRVPAGTKIVVGPSDTFQYTTSTGAVEPVIIVSYNDPQGNHRFILPASALVADLNNDITSLNGTMLADPGVDISSTGAGEARFVINAPHPNPITDGKLFVEYIDSQGNVADEDVFTQNFDSGPTVIPVSVDLNTYPADQYILLAFFTDSQGNIIDSSARPLASFGPDPAPEVNVTVGEWEVGKMMAATINIPPQWDFGTVQPGATLHSTLNIANTGLGDLRYSLSGFDSNLTLATGSSAGTLAPSQSRSVSLAIDTKGLPAGPFNKTLTLRTNDPSNGTLAIHITGIIGTAGQAAAYKINDFRPWDQYVYVPGPHNQNDVVSFTHTLVDNPTRMFPLYLYNESGSTLKGVGEYGVDFSGQTAPFGVFGTGADGDLTVTSGQTIYMDNTRSALASTASGGQNGLALSSASGFVAGQEVLVIQMQGTGAGIYEFRTIGGIAGNVIYLNNNLTNTYTVGGNSKAQVLRVMNYQNVTIQSGGVLTAHSWDGSTGGIVAFASNGNTSIQGIINVNAIGFIGGTGVGPGGQYSFQGDGYVGLQQVSDTPNGNGGGGGLQALEGGNGGGGGGNGTAGISGVTQPAHPGPGQGGLVAGSADLSTIFLGGGGGGGGRTVSNSGANGGNGGGIVLVRAKNITVNGGIYSNGTNGNGSCCTGIEGAGGGGAGGSILIKSVTASIGTNLISAYGGSGGSSGGSGKPGGAGGAGRIRIEYGTLSGTTNPAASIQHVNYYNMTGTNPTSLYMPDTIASGNYIRYSLQYGQRSSNTNSGDQLFSVRLPNRQYSSVTLSALNERVVGSGSTFNFCLDIGNDGVCDYTANNQSFSAPVRLDTTNLASALNAYITAHPSAQDYLTIPIRVNISTPADIFLFNLSSRVGNDADLVPTNFTITPPNGNPPNNIPEGSQVTLSAAVTNNGTHKAENFTVAFYNGDPANGGVLVGSTFLAALDGGATSSTQQVMWNTTGLLGDKMLYVKVDVSSAVAESNETNNTASAAAVIKKKADLLITSLSAPDAREGETVNASISVKNDGEADVTGAVISLYDGTPESGTLLGSTNVDVAKGQTILAQIPFSINTVGAHTLWAKADPADLVLEADETNNTASSSNQIGWDHLAVDAGGANDTAYSTSTGYGWDNGTTVTSCGTEIEKSYRQAGSSETLTYKFDNILPGRRYHLDLTFATCSGERWQDVLVDGQPVSETGSTVQPYHVTSTPQTVSLLLDPADYADGTITLSIRRTSGLNGPLVNIIDLQEIIYCYRDSGPGEEGWTSENHCGYDTTPVTDGFDGWGSLPEQTMRFGESGVNYKFTALDPAKRYNVRLTFYEDDLAGRDQRILFDGMEADTITLNSSAQYLTIPIPASTYADGQIVMSIQRVGGGEAIVNEVTLEEETRRYSSPSAPPTPTPTPTPIPPQVTVNSFTATWGGSQVNVIWSTTTEINNHHFNLYRSTDTFTWTEIATTPSQFQCGNFTSASPVNYFYTDTNVAYGMTYYYRLQYSGEGCGMGSAMAPLMALAAPPPVDPPAAFAKTSPSDEAVNRSLSLTLQWEESSGAEYYEYCYSESNDGNCPTWTESDDPTSTAITGLDPATTYYWQVRAVNSTDMTPANNGNWWSFTTRPDQVTISGNAGVVGATITYTGGSTTAEASGNYSFTVNYGWSGTVTPSKTGYNFTPVNRSYTNVTANQTAQNYTATLNTYTISGNAGVGDATITYTGGSTATDGTGAYSFTVTHGWSGTATPSKTGYNFTPVSKSYTNITADQTAQNYVAAQNEYTLTVTSAHGTVTKNPNQASYHYGDVITLTVTPDAGWTFTSWTPSLTDNQVTITGNTTVTANYTQNDYTLTVNSAHGTVTKNPNQATYHYGDVVQLIATPATGWSFLNWSGDLTGTANPGSVTIYGNTSVTANYNQKPTDIALSNNSVTENQPAGTLVGALTTTDSEPGDTHTYSFCGGTDDATFTLVGNTLNTAAVFDYETKNSYAICIRTDDGNGGTFDKTFPITVANVIETITATFRSSSTQDGWILETGEKTDKGGTINSTLTTLRLGDDSAKKQYRSILSFATGASLPDNATITKVTLKVRKQGIIGGGNPVTNFQGFMVDIKRGLFGTSALQAADFQTAASKTYGPFMTALGGGWYSINLTSGKAYINKLNTLSGLTQIRLRFKLDDNSNAIANYLSLYSGNAPAALRPQLIIEYYVP